MRRLVSLTAVLALLSFGLAACGDDESETTTTTGATGATGASGSTSGGELATAGAYMQAALPDQIKAVQAAVAADPDCEGVDAKPGGEFQVSVAIDAASASTDTSLSEIVNGQCTEN